MQLELKRIQTEVGITFVYVTHDQEEAMTMSDRIAVMRAGKVEQLGTAEDLYERPSTAFVAGFLGVSNLLDGRVIGHADGAIEVELSGGRRVRAASAALADGSTVRVGVRPEKLRLEATTDEAQAARATNGSNELVGRVSDASYVGVSTQYVVHLDDGQDVVVYAQNLDISGIGEQHAEGQRVRLSWLPKHTFVIATSNTQDKEMTADAQA
jgi:spermidine/putrescine transport system ATP-binding protein